MPAAFGLTTALISANLPEKKVFKHLTVFSFSAPVGALATYFLVVSFFSCSLLHFPELVILAFITSSHSMSDALLSGYLPLRGHNSRLP